MKDRNCIPLTSNNTDYIRIKRGKEKVWPLSFTFLLTELGFEKEELKKNWILSKGFYHEGFQVLIKTKDETISIDANDSCFKKEKQYFTDSGLVEKLEIIE